MLITLLVIAVVGIILYIVHNIAARKVSGDVLVVVDLILLVIFAVFALGRLGVSV